MSGGRFDYIQYRFSEIIDRIDQEIRNNNAEPRPVDWFTPNNYSKETLDEFRKGIEYLKKAQIYTQRIDWLLSGDDDEDTFHERLAEDFKEHGYKKK
jgi:hypothetical protein